jgi:predicted transposase/invertase (TIGR01784 family)
MLKRDIVTARIDGMICRAEKAGVEEGKLETARNMLEKGFPIEDIVDVTGLSEKDILNAE